MLKKTLSGVTAGLLISIGGAVFLSAENKVVGAVAITIGLLSICYYGLSLYTGKVGYLFEKHDKEALSVLFLGLLGNLIGSVCSGLLVQICLPQAVEKAKTICAAKLEKDLLPVFLLGAFCGILVYVAVNLYRDKKTVLGILIGIPVFILCGFEHSIADMFYLAAAGQFTLRALVFVLIVLAGNSAGALVFDRLLAGSGAKK